MATVTFDVNLTPFADPRKPGNGTNSMPQTIRTTMTEAHMAEGRTNGTSREALGRSIDIQTKQKISLTAEDTTAVVIKKHRNNIHSQPTTGKKPQTRSTLPTGRATHGLKTILGKMSTMINRNKQRLTGDPRIPHRLQNPNSSTLSRQLGSTLNITTLPTLCRLQHLPPPNSTVA